MTIFDRNGFAFRLITILHKSFKYQYLMASDITARKLGNGTNSVIQV